MAETEAKVKVTADARDLKAVERGMKEAFSPLSINKVKQAARELERDLKSLTAQQLRLTRAMRDVEKGSEGYDKLAKSLKEVKAQASAVEGTMSALNKAYGDLDRRSQRSRSFMGGVVQGAGIAQYIPAERGMYGRVAGAMVGGAMRRGIGGAAAPFMMPGMGGLSTMMGAMPLVGGFAQGALQTAAGMYQQYVGHQQARLQNLYLANESMGKDLGMGPNPARARIQRDLNEEVKRQDELWGRSRRLGQVKIGLRGGRVSEDVQSEVAARKTIQKGAVSAAMPALRAMRDAVPGAKLALKYLSTVPGAEAAVSKYLSPQQQANEEFKAAEAERRASTGRIQQLRERLKSTPAVARRGRASGLGAIDMASDFGIDPMQEEAMKGEMGAVSGGLFGRTQFVEAAAAKVRYGISMSTAGQFARAGLAGGGGTGTGAGLAGVLRSAVTQGLRGAQVVEYLQQMVQLSSKAEKEGVKLDFTEFTRKTAALEGLGIARMQRSRIAASLDTAAMQASATGIQGPAQMLLYRAAGFDPRKGRASYVSATEKMQGGIPADTMVNLLSMVAEASRGFVGETPEETMKMRAFHVRRMMAMPGIGVPISSGMATDILTKMNASKNQADFKKSLMEFSVSHGLAGAEQGPDALKWLVGGAKAGAKAVAPGAVSAAQLQAERIGGGGRMASTFVALERVGIESATVLGNFNKQIKSVVSLMERAIGAADKLTKGDLLANIKALLAGGSIPGGMPSRPQRRPRGGS